VDIMTNETTMSRTGGFSTYQAQGSAYQAGYMGAAQSTASGMSYTAPVANVGALPPDAMEFALDLRQSRVVTIGRNGFEVLAATPAGVTFRAY